MARSLKPSLTVEQHVELLRRRGMSVDEGLALQWLSNVSYYRLSAYWYPARSMDPRNIRTDNFVQGARFRDVVDLYESDRKLRTLVHDGMERIEVTMRTRMGELLCVNGPLAYLEHDRFRPKFCHSDWMKVARKRIDRAARTNESVKHYKYEYADKYPFWVLAEVLDFADVSRLFEGLPARDQRCISEGLEIVPDLGQLSLNQQRKVKALPPLVRWMEQLTVVRNVCAHHGRLWNKKFTPAPTVALRTQREFNGLPEGQSERIFGALTVMAHLLRMASPGTSWPDKISQVINSDFLRNPLVDPAAMGLPNNWSGNF